MTKATPVITIILDTNIVLDWLVFRDPSCVVLQACIEAGQLNWIATRAMRDELAHVLDRGSLDSRMPNTQALWSSWNRWCLEVPDPVRGEPTIGLRCSDPDDQKFIDLAVHRRPSWLLSRDRAVLRLARPLRGLGIEVSPVLILAAPA
jgi:predicted nucleic acid-binding protein